MSTLSWCNSRQQTATDCNRILHTVTHSNATYWNVPTSTYCNNGFNMICSKEISRSKDSHTCIKWIYPYIYVNTYVQQFLVLRQGWVWFKRTCIFIGIQFTQHFIEYVFVETNQLSGSNPSVILMRQKELTGLRKQTPGVRIWFRRTNLLYIYIFKNLHS